MHRRRLAFVFGLLVFASFVCWVHGYFVRRLVVDSGMPQPWSLFALLGICGLGSLIFVYPLADRVLGSRVGRLFAWPTMLWLGTAFQLLLLLAASDLVLTLFGLHGPAIDRARAIVVAIATLCSVLVSLRAGMRPPAIKRVELTLERWPQALDGYRIVQLSDVHIGPTLRRAFAAQLVERCNALAPDLLAITGDLVDGSVASLADEVAPFAQLRARDGVYFVTGNHDHYSNAERWVQKVRELGIEVLRNRSLTIERAGGERFELAGVDDFSTRGLSREHAHDLNAALSDWRRDSALVLLAHDPRTFDHACALGIDLQLSGHTHGGQMWPFGWLVRIQTPYVAGEYQRERSLLYVSRGTGYWGPPMRLFSSAEITELQIRSARS